MSETVGGIPRNADDTGDPLRRVPRQMTQIGPARPVWSAACVARYGVVRVRRMGVACDRPAGGGPE